MFSLVCIERILLRGMQKGSIEGLSMEINLEICNRTIKCSSGESSLLIHRKESLNNFYFTKEQKQDKRDNFVFVASVLVAVSWTGLDCCTSNLQRTRILPGNVSTLAEWNRDPQMIYFSCFRTAPVILCTVTVKARAQSKLLNYILSWELPWTDSESLKTWLDSEWSGTSKGLIGWLVRQLLQQFYSYSFFHHAPDLLGSRTVVQLSWDWSEVHMFIRLS